MTTAAVVAGVSDPVGLACITRLADEGHRVTALVASEPDRLRALGVGAVEAVADTRWDEDALAAVAATSAFDDGLAALVNAHLLVEPGGVESTPITDWRRALEWMVLGPLSATRAFLPALRRARGAVVHLGSVDGALGNPGVPMYSTAKGALTPLTHVMAHEFGRDGVRVTSVARAAVAGSGIPGASDDVVTPVIGATPLGRLADPSEVADVVAYLVSGRASFVTGTVVTVDGGRTATTHATRSWVDATPPPDPGAT